jgi:hypothetical protein
MTNYKEATNSTDERFMPVGELTKAETDADDNINNGSDDPRDFRIKKLCQHVRALEELFDV